MHGGHSGQDGVTGSFLSIFRVSGPVPGDAQGKRFTLAVSVDDIPPTMPVLQGKAPDGSAFRRL